jgi:hypothetical protein
MRFKIGVAMFIFPAIVMVVAVLIKVPEAIPWVLGLMAWISFAMWLVNTE